MSRALVIDDSSATRMILSRMLGEIGYEVHTAPDGFEALGQMEALQDVALLMVDWNMPRMDGLEFVRRLRADPRYSSATVIMVTTETELDHIIQAVDAGANEYIMKPFTKEIVEDKLRLLHVLH